MVQVLVQFFGAAGVIVIAGVALTRIADKLSDRLGLGKMLAGGILIAAATSLPELSVAISAVGLGYHDLAVGGLFGSNLFNLLLLGLIDLAFRSKGRILSTTSAAHALSGCMSIGLIAIPAFMIATKSQGTWLNLGWGSWILFMAYFFGIRLAFFDQKYLMRKQHDSQEGDENSQGSSGWLMYTLSYCGVAAVIFFAAPHLSSSAGELARITGVEETFVGTTLVALATSLPELVTTVAAVRLGSVDMAVGNIFGSNSFNMVIIAVTDIAYGGSLLGAVSPTHLMTCLAAIFITSIIIMGQLCHAEKPIAFVEPDAILVILLVIGSLITIYTMG